MSMWTAATDELTQWLVQREVEKRQAMLDAIAKQDRDRQEEDRQRRIARETATQGQHDLLFEQAQRDRAEKLKQEAIEKQRTDTRERLGAMRQASVNAAPGDPTGAQATRGAIDVALRLAGGGAEAEAAQKADITRQQTADKQRDIAAYLANPTDAGARQLEVRWGVRVPKPEIRELNRNNRLVRVDDGGAKVLVGALAPEGGGAGGQIVPDKDGRIDGMTLGAIDNAAERYNRDGSLPTRLTAKQKTAILNRADERDPDANVFFNKTTGAADAASLRRLQAQADQIDSFEDTATANLSVLMSKAPAIFDAGSPWVNKTIRELANSAAGSPEQAAYNTARRVVIPEFAKLLNNPGATGGQLTDTARREVEDIINESATMGQIAAAADVLRTDAANRRNAVHRQIGAVRQRLKTGKSGDDKSDDKDTGAATTTETPEQRKERLKKLVIGAGSK